MERANGGQGANGACGSSSPTMGGARNRTVRVAGLASPERVETMPQGDRPRVGDHLRTHPISSAGKTGDLRPAFRSARKSFVLRKSWNMFGGRHLACANCPTGIRSGSHSASPLPRPSLRTRFTRRPLTPSSVTASEKGMEDSLAHRWDITAGAVEASKRAAVERWTRPPQVAEVDFFTATGAETTRRSRNSKALRHLRPENPPWATDRSRQPRHQGAHRTSVVFNPSRAGSISQ